VKATLAGLDRSGRIVILAFLIVVLVVAGSVWLGGLSATPVLQRVSCPIPNANGQLPPGAPSFCRP